MSVVAYSRVGDLGWKHRSKVQERLSQVSQIWIFKRGKAGYVRRKHEEMVEKFYFRARRIAGYFDNPNKKGIS